MNKNILKSLYISIICPTITLFILPYFQNEIAQEFYRKYQRMEPSNYFLFSFIIWFSFILCLYYLAKISLRNINKITLICLMVGFSLSLFLFITCYFSSKFIYNIKIPILITSDLSPTFVLISFSLYTILLIETLYNLYKVKKHIL